MRRGASLRKTDVVLRAGRAIGPAEVGLLAEIGAAHVSVYPRPSVAILATGSELTPHHTRPGPGQIRNSNGPMLRAQVVQAGAQAVLLDIGRDDVDHLRPLIRLGLEEDVLVLSGGVSAGARDLAPRALQQAGVRQVFHQVLLKPGKPLWFGVADSAGAEKLVFGLPGNPVSTYVCFELFVRRALMQLAGRQPAQLELRQARLERDHVQQGDRPTYHPSTLRSREGRLVVEPLPWQGSADLRTLTDANCLACFPAGDRVFSAGEIIDVHPL
jgi:molybdopterin molybdotransferase